MNKFHFIDRRKNPKGKSLGNRQRFLKRARAQIKEAVQKSLRDRSVSDMAKGGKISIPSKPTAEPRFRLAAIFAGPAILVCAPSLLHRATFPIQLQPSPIPVSACKNETGLIVNPISRKCPDIRTIIRS